MVVNQGRGGGALYQMYHERLTSRTLDQSHSGLSDQINVGLRFIYLFIFLKSFIISSPLRGHNPLRLLLFKYHG